MAQAYLSDFETEPEREPEPKSEPTLEDTHPQTATAPSAMTESDANACLNCGTRYDKSYRRVFGDRDNRLHCCPNCKTQNAMKRGEGAGR